MNEPLTEHEAQQAEAGAIIQWLQPDSLTVIQTRAEGEQIEAMSAAAIAYYREQEDYAGVVKAWRLYVEARRQTTGLCLQEWQGNTDVTLSEMGFTKMQWHRRMKEYNLPAEQVNTYFDECIANGWQPSIAGMLKATGNGSGGGDEYQRHVDSLVSAAEWLNAPERTLERKASYKQTEAVRAVLKAFKGEQPPVTMFEK